MRRDSFDGNVLVRVGPEKSVFRFHQKLICDVAPYFEAAFTGNFKEEAEGCLDLPTEDVEMFKHFELWVYTGKILATWKTPKDIKFQTLVKIYLFGEVRGIPELQNSAMDLIIEKFGIEDRFPTSTLQIVYENSPSNSLLRKLLVDIFAGVLFKKDPKRWFLKNDRVIFPNDFLIETLIAQSRLRKQDAQGNYH